MGLKSSKRNTNETEAPTSMNLITTVAFNKNNNNNEETNVQPPIVESTPDSSTSNALTDDGQEINVEPIIGILSVEIPGAENGMSYIPASYVKSLESGGSRVIPIWIGQTKEYYENIMYKINGVLFPGGDAAFDKSNGYADAGRHIYKIAIELNERGIYMPLWGTCLGFEFLAYISSGEQLVLSTCSSESISLAIKFRSDYRNSRLFGKRISRDILKIISTEQVTANFHHYCITMKDLKDYGLDSSWKVLSTSEDLNGCEFISTMEHKKYPFFGVQFHPEKSIFEWIKDKNICHTENSIKAAQYFANFFVDQCRENDQHFDNGRNNEKLSLIYNYPVTYTGISSSHFNMFEECYFFDKDIAKIE